MGISYKIVIGMIYIYILVMLSSVEALAQTNASIKPDNNVIQLPTQSILANNQLITVDQSAKAAQWESFTQKYGKWSLLIDKATGTPRNAFGEPIKIKGYAKITETNVEEAATSFLMENQNLFNIDVSQLKLVRKDLVNNKWYVTLKQYYKGVEVLLSNIDLRLHENGNLMAFNIEFYNNIEIALTPKISFSQAKDYAAKGITGKLRTDAIQSNKGTFILPIKNGSEVTYHLVYKVAVNSTDKPAKYISYVDASNGKVLWRYNIIMNAAEFEVKGGVKKRCALDSVTIEKMPDMFVKVGDKIDTSDKNGMIKSDINATKNVEANLEGRWGKIICNGKNNAAFNGKIEPGKPFELLWDDNNSHRFERNEYYYVNQIHDYIKAIDPQLTCVDKPIVVQIGFTPDMMYGDRPNAGSMGDTIMFFNCQVDSMRMAETPSILYHEYGHSINTLFYQSRGKADGMINMMCHEALADITGALILDEPKVGIGTFWPDTMMFIRNCKNSLVYPDSIDGESHHDGQILSGAFWDLREMTSCELVGKLAHFARYGLPDDANDGAALEKWFMEVLIADDDDGNLANGTPHSKDIVKAFNNHKIGSALFYANRFTHVPLKDTKETEKPYPVKFSFGEKNTLFGLPDSTAIVFSVKKGDNTQPPVIVPAVLKSGDTKDYYYYCEIPAQQKGSEVFYCIKVKDKISGTSFEINPAKSSFPYSFLVGYKPALADDFEKETGWETGSGQDNATSGLWVRCNPKRLDFANCNNIKPEDDHTEEGTQCFTTSQGPEPGADMYSILFNNLPNGIITLTSPEYDITKLENVILQYYIYFYQAGLDPTQGDMPQSAKFVTELSNDGGKTWTKAIVDTTGGEASWRKIRIRFEDYLPLSQNCRIRFRYYGDKIMYVYPATICSITIDDFEISTLNDNILGVPESAAQEGSSNARPNPFSDRIDIYFLPEQSCMAYINIYDLFGNKVFGKDMAVIPYQDNHFSWDGKGINGVEEGVYIYRITAGCKVFTGKIIKN